MNSFDADMNPNDFAKWQVHFGKLTSQQRKRLMNMPPLPHPDIGNALSEWRKRKGLLQRQVALRLGIASAFLSQIENGKHPSPNLADKIFELIQTP